MSLIRPPYRPPAVSRSSVPAPKRTRVPWVSWALRVMMLITPLTALAPHMVAPGPRITSIRSMSSMRVFCSSQKVLLKAGE